MCRYTIMPMSGPADQFAQPWLEGYSLHEVTIAELQQHYSASHFTITEYVTHCLDYIHILNPYLAAVIETSPDALSIAQALDKHRAAPGADAGPLHGVSGLVKDSMATRDAMQTTAGSLALLGSVVPADAHVVKLLRNTGAVILGHANMDEWASIRSPARPRASAPAAGSATTPTTCAAAPTAGAAGPPSPCRRA